MNSKQNLHNEWIIEAQDAERSLMSWCREHFSGASHGLLQKLLRQGKIRVNQKQVTSTTKLQVGDQLLIKDQRLLAPSVAADQKERAPQKIREADALTAKDKTWIQSLILAEEEDFLVLNKPFDLPVQGGEKIKRSLDQLLVLYFKTRGDKEMPRLVHRIDRHTSGVLIVAKNYKAARYFTQAFKDHDVKKTYQAVVIGVPHPEKGTIDTPLIKGEAAQKEKMMVYEADPTSRSIAGAHRVLKAHTTYKTLQNTCLNTTDISLMELTPTTGRKHQLRVHMASIGHPILGDGKYGGSAAHPEGKRFKLHLHCAQLAFKGPDKKSYVFKAPLPDYFCIP